MHAELKQRWVEALRSGEFVQGRMHLLAHSAPDKTPRYCCLGVLCHLAGEELIQLGGEWVPASLEHRNGVTLQPGSFGLSGEQLEALTGMNDGLPGPSRNFTQIAGWIDANIPEDA